MGFSFYQLPNGSGVETWMGNFTRECRGK